MSRARGRVSTIVTILALATATAAFLAPPPMSYPARGGPLHPLDVTNVNVDLASGTFFRNVSFSGGAVKTPMIVDSFNQNPTNSGQPCWNGANFYRDPTSFVRDTSVTFDTGASFNFTSSQFAPVFEQSFYLFCFSQNVALGPTGNYRATFHYRLVDGTNMNYYMGFGTISGGPAWLTGAVVNGSSVFVDTLSGSHVRSSSSAPAAKGTWHQLDVTWNGASSTTTVVVDQGNAVTLTQSWTGTFTSAYVWAHDYSADGSYPTTSYFNVDDVTRAGPRRGSWTSAAQTRTPTSAGIAVSYGIENCGGCGNYVGPVYVNNSDGSVVYSDTSQHTSGSSLTVPASSLGTLAAGWTISVGLWDPSGLDDPKITGVTYAATIAGGGGPLPTPLPFCSAHPYDPTCWVNTTLPQIVAAATPYVCNLWSVIFVALIAAAGAWARRAARHGPGPPARQGAR